MEVSSPPIHRKDMSEETEEGSEGGKKCSNLRFPITIEPLVLLYTLSVGLNEVIRSNLIMEKICQVGMLSLPRKLEHDIF